MKWIKTCESIYINLSEIVYFDHHYYPVDEKESDCVIIIECLLSNNEMIEIGYFVNKEEAIDFLDEITKKGYSKIKLMTYDEVRELKT
jgi:hypothetical protein